MTHTEATLNGGLRMHILLCPELVLPAASAFLYDDDGGGVSMDSGRPNKRRLACSSPEQEAAGSTAR